MKCVICKHGETRSGKTTITLERGESTMVIKDVPADVCQDCEEAYLTENISSQLLRMAEEGASEGILVDVRHFKVA